MSLKARFGSTVLTTGAAFDHYLVVGGTGSGKSTYLQVLMGSVLNEPVTLPPGAFIYDPKREFLPVIEGLGRAGDCVILNPMDQRCSAWDLGRDFRDPVAARELATILTDEPSGHSDDNVFFRNAVRDILTAVMVAFIRLSREDTPAWTLRDVILTCIHPQYLEAVLAHTRDPFGTPMLTSIRVDQVYFKRADPRTRANIEASLQSMLGRYEAIAAVWDWALSRPSGTWPQTFSLTDWIERGDVLLLGNDETARASLDPINRAIFQRSAQIVLSTPSQDVASTMGRTWFFLDEVREAGPLTLLPRLLTKARSHGVSVVLAFQDVEGMKEEYGENVALEVIAQCNNKAILKIDSPSTAEWAASLFGEYLGPEASISDTSSSHPSRTTSYHRTVRQNLYSSQLLFIPRTSTKTGISSYTKHGEQDPIEPLIASHADWNNDIEPYLPKKTMTPAFEPHSSPSVFYLREFEESDWQRLGLDGSPPSIMNS